MSGMINTLQAPFKFVAFLRNYEKEKVLADRYSDRLNRTVAEFKEIDTQKEARSVVPQKIHYLKRNRILQQDELPRLLDALANVANATMRDFLMVSLLAGERKSYTLAMRWDEIDFHSSIWRIVKRKNAHVVRLSPQVFEVLVTREKMARGPWVFPGRGATGHLVNPSNTWKRVLLQAGIEDLRISDLYI